MPTNWGQIGVNGGGHKLTATLALIPSDVRTLIVILRLIQAGYISAG